MTSLEIITQQLKDEIAVLTEKWGIWNEISNPHEHQLSKEDHRWISGWRYGTTATLKRILKNIEGLENEKIQTKI